MGGLEYETLVNKTMLWRKNHSWQQPRRGMFVHVLVLEVFYLPRATVDFLAITP